MSRQTKDALKFGATVYGIMFLAAFLASLDAILS